MWLVWSYDDGVTMITVDKDKAIKEYKQLKQSYIDSLDGEFNGDEHVILAKVEKQFYCDDTGEPVIKYDEKGNEFETVIHIGIGVRMNINKIKLSFK